MSVRDYLSQEPLLFVSDMMRGSDGLPGCNSNRQGPRTPSVRDISTTKTTLASHTAVVQPAPSIYDRVRKRKRAIEEETQRTDELQEELDRLKSERDQCTKRYQIKRRTELNSIIEEKAENLASVVSGKKLSDFIEAAAPYLEAYQRQSFCRPRGAQGTTLAQTSSAADVADSTPPGNNTALNEYTMALEDAPPKFEIDTKDLCKACGNALQLHTALSMLVCTECGCTQPYLDATAALLAFTDDSYDYTSFSYKRINHFSEWIAAMQAKESTDIPDSVIQAVMERLVDERVDKIKDVTVHKVRDVLKKLKLRKFYEHTQLITSKITGLTPPRLSPMQEERIKLLFMAASTAFQQHCPPDRSNFLSYAYTLSKLSELLGYSELKDQFSLLKCRAKLERQDAIFKVLCEALDWQFVPSV
jgi:hypothetical protein